MKKLLLSTLIASATLSYAVGIEGSIGTLGTGVGITLPIEQSDFSIKLNANTINTNLFANSASVNANSYGLLLDYRLWKGLSVNGGVYYNKGTLNYNHTLLTPEYQQTQIENYTSYAFDGFSPYLGLSYKADIYKGWYINTDAGIMSINTTKTHHTTTEMINNDQLLQSTYTQTTSAVDYYPVVKVSIGFDF